MCSNIMEVYIVLIIHEELQTKSSIVQVMLQ